MVSVVTRANVKISQIPPLVWLANRIRSTNYVLLQLLSSLFDQLRLPLHFRLEFTISKYRDTQYAKAVLSQCSMYGHFTRKHTEKQEELFKHQDNIISDISVYFLFHLCLSVFQSRESRVEGADKETGRRADKETGRRADKETGGQGEWRRENNNRPSRERLGYHTS